MGWNIDQSSDAFLSFIILTHLATALALLAFFYRDWIRIIRDMVRSIIERRFVSAYARIGALIIVSSIPAGILGFIFQAKLQELFASARLVAVVLILNGIVLYIAELLRAGAPRGADDRKLARMSLAQSIGIGIAQCLALIPGFSRTGTTMTAGLMNGFSHENAARYSFLLATPIIFAAAVLKVPHIITHHGEWSTAIAGFISAALFAYLSVRFLTGYFRTNTLKPFALYCVIAGALAFAILTAGF